MLADEPTADLDKKTEQEIMDFLRELNRGGTTLIMVTHNVELVAFADRTFEMGLGRLAEYRRGMVSI